MEMIRTIARFIKSFRYNVHDFSHAYFILQVVTTSFLKDEYSSGNALVYPYFILLFLLSESTFTITTTFKNAATVFTLTTLLTGAGYHHSIPV